MSKILATLAILGVCVSVAFSATATPLAQSASFTGMNSTSTKVYNGANTTVDALTWGTVLTANIAFGPGTDNTTIYVYGWKTTTTNSIASVTTIYRRTLNATIVAWANDTSLASVSADVTISPTIPATAGSTYAVGPGYFAILSSGSDGTNQQVYVTVLASSSSSASPTKITAVSDVTATPAASTDAAKTETSFTVGNVWYDIGSGAFFYTYTKKVITTAWDAQASQAGTPTTAYTINVGGVYVNNTAYWASPLAITPATPANLPSSLMAGGDNWLNATNIWIVWKDATAGNTYYSKVTKAAATTAAGSATLLVADVTATYPSKIYVPIGVWASNFTYGIAASLETASAATSATYTYSAVNFLNGTTSPTDAGLNYSSAASAPVSFAGWMLSTGYTNIATYSASGVNTVIWGTFYGNGTVNSTAATLGSIQGPYNFFPDVNGTMWVGWTDPDTTNSVTYNGYLAKLQGQINVASSSANALTTLLAFVALCLATLFAF